jgi:hypothetical protein
MVAYSVAFTLSLLEFLNSPWQSISSLISLDGWAEMKARSNACVALFSLDGRWDMSPANFRKTHVGLM